MRNKALKSAKLATKIYLLLAGALTANVLTATILMLAINNVGSSYSSLFQNEVRQADLARQMQVTFKKQVQAWKDILLRGQDPAALRKYTGEFHTSAAKVVQTGETLRDQVRDPDARAKVQAFLDAHQTLGGKYAAALQAFTQAAGMNSHEVDKMVKGQDRAATDDCDQIVEALTAVTARSSAALDQTNAKRIRMTSLILLGVMIVLAATAVRMIRATTATLRGVVADIHLGAEHVAAAAGQVSGSSQTLAQGSTEQAASLEETSASCEEINSMARRNLQNSQSMATLVASSQSKFEQTNGLLGEMVAAMNDINTQSGKISNIIKTIDEIAFQTNILALNASVEAARAGESGRGFAVVADEVRNLAERCSRAAKDTSTLIEESIAKSGDGKVKVDQVAHAIADITVESAQVKELTDEVTLGSQEQAKGLEQIALALTQMEQVTQTTAANADQSASASEELNQQSGTLKEVVQQLSAMVG